MKRYLGLWAFMVITLCRLHAAEEEWIGIATDKVFNFREKKQINVPSLEVGTKFFLLTGKELVTLEALKKSRFYIVTGTLSNDGKTIIVSKMVPRSEYQGVIYVGRPNPKIAETPYLILGENGRAWYLHGNLPDFSTIKKGTKWKVNGTEDDDNHWITVISMSIAE